MRVRLYKKTKDNLSYFQILTNDGQALLNSQGYADKDDRNNGVRSVVANANNPARYERQTSAEGKNFFLLKAGNGQEIARSLDFDDAASMEAAISAARAEIPGLTGLEDGEGLPREVATAEAPAAPAPVAATTPQNEVDRGTARGRATTTGSVLKEAGAGIPGNIEGMAFYRATVRIADAPPPKEKAPKEKKKRKPREAKTKSAGDKVILKSGKYLFNRVTWQTMRSANGKYYFSFRTGEGKSLMLSSNVKGFATEGEVDDMVQKILEIGPYEGNYEGKTTANKKYYFYLKDTTGKPVAKSFFYSTTADMQDAIGLLIGRVAGTAAVFVDDYLACERYSGEPAFHRFFNNEDNSWYFGYNNSAGKALLRSEGYTTEKARDNGIESVTKNAPIEDRWVTGQTADFQYYYALHASNNQEIARSCYLADEESMNAGLAAAKDAFAPKVEKAAEASASKVDDYLSCEAYAGGEGYHKFEHEGKYYFSYNSKSGSVILRSEGYKSEAARDNGIESVKKNLPVEERWVKKQHEDGRWYFSLLAGNRQEIARTCYHDEATLFGILRSAVGPLYTPPPPPRSPESVVAPAPAIVNDYLPCEAYAGEAGKDGFRRFKQEGEFYFAYLDKDGDVVLRSEGYKSEGARDNGVESVKKNAPIEERWVKETTDDGKHYWSLKAGNRQEIARSCYKETLGAAGWGIFTAAAAAVPMLGAAAATVAVPPPPPPPLVPVPAPVIEKLKPVVPPPTPPPVPVAGPVVVETSGGGFKWWWLLPLLLLAMLFFLWKGCDGCGKVTPPPVEDTTDSTPTPADTVKE